MSPCIEKTKSHTNVVTNTVARSLYWGNCPDTDPVSPVGGLEGETSDHGVNVKKTIL